MKQITTLLTDLPYRLVNFGIDTLILNVRYADENGAPLHSELIDSQIDQLNEWQALAKEQEQPVPVPLTFNGANLLMPAHGAGKGQWRWLLTNDFLNLCISRGRLNGILAQVRLSARLLWSAENPHTHKQDIWPLVQAFETFLTTVFRLDGSTRLHLQVSEIHLCADTLAVYLAPELLLQAKMAQRNPHEFSRIIVYAACHRTLRVATGGKNAWRYYRDTSSERKLPCSASGSLSVRSSQIVSQFGDILRSVELTEQWKKEILDRCMSASETGDTENGRA